MIDTLYARRGEWTFEYSGEQIFTTANKKLIRLQKERVEYENKLKELDPAYTPWQSLKEELKETKEEIKILSLYCIEFMRNKTKLYELTLNDLMYFEVYE